jgi:predicted NUDIX family phosphoesterase
VLVVERQTLFGSAPADAAASGDGRASDVQGFVPGPVLGCLDTARTHGSFLPRSQVEDDDAYKQLIPYGVLIWKDQVFVMRRAAKKGDARLREKISLGVGGHVNIEDARTDDAPEQRLCPDAAIEKALHREISEELHLDTSYALQAIGVLNDDSNAVGRVHFGIVYIIEVDSPDVTIREHESLSGGFLPLAGLTEHVEEMETWSRILYEGGALANLARPQRRARPGNRPVPSSSRDASDGQA